MGSTNPEREFRILGRPESDSVSHPGKSRVEELDGSNESNEVGANGCYNRNCPMRILHSGLNVAFVILR